jgi:hypothetical protein
LVVEIIWELHGLGFFAFQFQWDPNFIMKVLQNLGPFSFKLHHNVIGPLYVVPSFFVFDVMMRIFFQRRNKIKLWNTHI